MKYSIPIIVFFSLFSFSEAYSQGCNGFASLSYLNIGNAEVSFTNTSSVAGSITSFAWSFGDGSTSTLSSPTHTYSTDGLYTVTINVTSQQNVGCDITLTCNDSTSITIMINNSNSAYGCMDTSALNYNPSATIDDGSCILGATWVTLQMNDSYGDGWNGDTWSAISTIGTSGHGPYTLINTSSGSQSFLLPDDCYDIICDFGSYPFETSWLLMDDNGITLASGGSPYNSTLATGTGSCPILGCTDYTACNYNEEAMEDDGSCAFPGMTCTDVNTLGVYDDNCECVDDVNGVSDLPVNRTIKIYPNPSYTHITIENPNQETVWVFDTMGRKVYSSMDRKMVLCQDDFTPGSYFVKMGVRSAKFVFE